MPYEPTLPDYDPLTPAVRRSRASAEDASTRPRREHTTDEHSSHEYSSDEYSWHDDIFSRHDDGHVSATGVSDEGDEDAALEGSDSQDLAARNGTNGEGGRRELRTGWEWPRLRRGHAVSFAGLLLFTAVVYFRPQEFISALATLSPSLAFWIAVATLAVFLPAQLGIEGTLTTRPREVNLVLLLLLWGLIGMPLALEPAEAWGTWVDYAKVVTMFVVMINVVRTEGRLRAMLWLALVVSLMLSVSALYDYHTGKLAPNGDRIEGALGGLFENPNDLALHLVTMVPLAAGLLFAARTRAAKALYGAAALLMTLAVIITYSRGGFLALACASFVMAWKLKRKNRALVVVGFLVAGAIFFMVVPPDWVVRLMSTLGGGADGGSAESRQALLIRSILVSLRHPLFGVGMNNFHILSISEKVSHNAYTQVSAEMGMPALAAYVLFLVTAIRRMSRVERETADERKSARVFYIAVAMQASLAGYMVASFFASVAYLWYVYYLVGYALCLDRLYAALGAEAFGLKVNSRARVAEAGESRVNDEDNDSVGVSDEAVFGGEWLAARGER